MITGGYGFIGSTVAERFHKEGYDVYIIDNMSSGSKKNINFKHKGYVLSVEDTKCEEVFRSNRFDAVIHLAAQVSVSVSLKNPYQDAESNVLGLTNMLSLSSRYGARKFIFASSAAVYGVTEEMPIPETSPFGPISPYGMNKMVGEMYCSNWKEMYGLDTLCFRFSNVYGPRQGSSGEGGVVSIFMKQMLENQEITVHGDGNQTRDFIYVEDIADALFRASYSSLDGVYNLSNCQENSINDLIRELQQLQGDALINYVPSREGDVYSSTLDNARIMHALDWSPKYTLQSGLHKMYAWARESKETKPVVKTIEEKPSMIRQKLKTALPYAENLLAFSAVYGLNEILERSDYAGMDFKLVYITIIGILYGSRQSMLAVLLSILLFIRQQTENGRDVVSLLYDSTLFFQFALYLFVGLVVGYSIERRTNRLNNAEQQLQQASDKYAFLYEVYEETRSVKDELHHQIITTEDSFGKIHTVTRELESLEPERIFLAAIGVLEKIMQTDQVTIYTVNKTKSYLRLAGCSAVDTLEFPRSLKADQHEYLMSLLYDKQLYVNKELNPELPLLSAPVVSRGEVVAIVSLHAVEFHRFTLYYQNLFKTVVELISSSLSRAHTYIDAAASQRYVDPEEGRVLQTEAFMEILASKQAASEQFGVNYVLLPTGLKNVNSEIIERIHRSLRETDYLGMSADGELLMLLSNSTQSDVEHIVRRLRGQSVFLHLEEEPKYA
ncbi:NAD-dependent epimerase/dehydratase family protein [Paenibacillus wynnii]|uniref:NAD-dependent epimerase/dehydratase family protein n=1 Tax=Paenibacillus wynnii TaxID=268407 RepID=UPI00278F3F73|nr:NAD-dependent epimerase/dehydratase family protein [Paenibacillus wynnii]MDQ0193531.1 nucleoside-diphosphate-sugar epimerase [Paenibacillus wynnii]